MRKIGDLLCNQMGMEVLEGLRVSQSQQQPTLQEKQQRDPFPSRYRRGKLEIKLGSGAKGKCTVDILTNWSGSTSLSFRSAT